MSGAAAIDSIGPTEAKVTPIITGSRMPTPGKPIHCTSVASPQANRSALIRNATSSGGSFSARPMISGTATAPAYMTSTCCRPSASSRGAGSIWSTGWISLVVVMDFPQARAFGPARIPIQGPCQKLVPGALPRWHERCSLLDPIGRPWSRKSPVELEASRAADQEQIRKGPRPRDADPPRRRAPRGQPAQRQGDDRGRLCPRLYPCRQFHLGVDRHHQERRQYRRPRKHRALHRRILPGAGEKISRHLCADRLGRDHRA